MLNSKYVFSVSQIRNPIITLFIQCPFTWSLRVKLFAWLMLIGLPLPPERTLSLVGGAFLSH